MVRKSALLFCSTPKTITVITVSCLSCILIAQTTNRHIFHRQENPVAAPRN